MIRTLFCVGLLISNMAAAVTGPVVAARHGVTVAGEAAFLGKVGSRLIFYGEGAKGAGDVILVDGRGRFFYLLEGVSESEAALYGDVLLADAGEVLIARRFGFVYERSLKKLNAPWRQLIPMQFNANYKPVTAPAGSPGPDARIQNLLTRIRDKDITDDLASLTAIPTRYSYSPYLDDAAAWVRDRLRDAGLSPRYETFITGHDFYSCFFFPGTDDGWLVGANGLVLRTTDGGTSWVIENVRTDEDLVDIFFYDAAHGWIVGANGTALRTSDGGATWQKCPRFTDKHLTGVYFVSADEGWTCGTAGTVFHTADGGRTWEQQPTNFSEAFFEIQFLDNLRGYVVGWHGEVRRTDDGGRTWQRKRTPFSDPQSPDEVVELTGLSFVSPQEGWVVGNNYDVILYTADGGDSWTIQRYDVARGGYLGAVQFWDKLNGVAVGGEEGDVLWTSDGGAHWHKVDAPAEYPLTGVSFSSAQTGWACGYGSCIDVTSDGGRAWRSVRDNLPPSLGWKNIVCDIPGKAEPDVQYLITAHYDSISDRPWELAPGADDNGSGVVAAIAFARAAASANFQRTIRFVFFAGEEQGLVGSRDYARRARERGDDIRAAWNMDMVGYVGGGPDDAVLYFNEPSAWMFAAARTAKSLYVPELYLTGENNPFMTASDHYSFWEKGYAATLLHENDANGVYPHYHKTTDTLDKLYPPFIAANARLAAATVVAWAGITGGSKPLTLSNVRVYPNPFKVGTGTARGVTFADVPSDAVVAVYDLAGRKVAAGRPDSGGVWFWDARVASGVYIYHIQRNGERIQGKVAVLR